MELSGQFHALATLPLENAPSIHYIGGWVTPRAILDMAMKKTIMSLLEIETRYSIPQPASQPASQPFW
jgi:hypothetical protein